MRARIMLDTCKDRCPYCGELIELVIDTSIEAQEYIEDCEVCCRPIIVNVIVSDDGLQMTLVPENA